MTTPDSNVELPGGAAGAPAAHDGAGAMSATGPGILLVDDDHFMLRVQSLMLRGLGHHRVTAARSGADALDILRTRSEPVDIIICDLNMPGMDGIEFLQAVNARSLHVGVILLSGEGTRIMHTVQKLLGNGSIQILGALEKPATADALGALLGGWTPRSVPAPAKVSRLYAASDIHAATRDGQWVLHYQPKVGLRNGELAGVEALIRWNHPSHGLVFPDDFIGVAEDGGAIDGVTDWVCCEALRQQARWHGAGLHIEVAVNVSMENLRGPAFARRLGLLAREAGAAPQDLMIEITESRLMSPSPAPLESLVRLRLQRFGLSIDDFGTGHSSLAQLRDVPFTELKVDRSFVRGARDNAIIRPMLEGSIGIAKRLDMRSVAEGVETDDDWQVLREIECDLAQGYFIGRPMPCERLPQWIDEWQGRRGRLIAR